MNKKVIKIIGASAAIIGISAVVGYGIDVTSDKKVIKEVPITAKKDNEDIKIDFLDEANKDFKEIRNDLSKYNFDDLKNKIEGYSNDFDDIKTKAENTVDELNNKLDEVKEKDIKGQIEDVQDAIDEIDKPSVEDIRYAGKKIKNIEDGAEDLIDYTDDLIRRIELRKNR